jgi:capsule polysaccharide export protein KpsE/RkpR
VSLSSSAPAREPLPELPEHGFPSLPENEGPPAWDHRSVEHLRLLWDHRGLLGRAALCGLVASVIIALLIQTRYESSTRLMSPDSNQSSGLALAATAISGSSNGLAGMATDLLGLKSTSDTFVGILSSRTVRDKLIQQFNLEKVYGVSSMEGARAALAAHTGIFVDRKSQIITITVTDHDPKVAAAMGQAYVEELNRLVAELSTSSARRERVFLEERLQAVNKELESAEKEFSQFASKNEAIDVKEQGKAMVEAAATLQGQLIAAESEYEGLKQIYTDNNVRVRSVKARIDELKHQLDKLGGKGESMTEVSSQPSESLYPSIRKLPLLGVTYADLYRRTRVQEAVFETLTKEYELAKVQEAKEIPVVKVLDPPDIPDKKSYPPRSLICFLGIVSGFVFGMTLVLGRQAWAATDACDPRKVFALEVWSTVSSRAQFVSKNGSGLRPFNGRGWRWGSWRNGSSKEQSKQG